MPNKMLIDASHQEETRVVVVRGNRIEEFDFESQDKKQLKGNIYLARVTRVEPSLQAAFVEYGGNRHGFLAFSEIHPDYYQIPVADRQALLRAEAEAPRGRRRRRGRRGTRPRTSSPSRPQEPRPREPKGFRRRRRTAMADEENATAEATTTSAGQRDGRERRGRRRFPKTRRSTVRPMTTIAALPTNGDDAGNGDDERGRIGRRRGRDRRGAQRAAGPCAASTRSRK